MEKETIKKEQKKENIRVLRIAGKVCILLEIDGMKIDVIYLINSLEDIRTLVNILENKDYEKLLELIELIVITQCSNE